MICLSTQFLALIGIADVQPMQFLAPGVFVSSLFSFGGRGGRAAVDQLATEPEPRSLILVGMGDRYDEGAGLGATVLEFCQDSSMGGARKPTPQEATEILAALEDGIVVGPLVPICDALRRIAETRAV